MNYRYIGNGASLELNPAACTGCGICTAVCPHAVLEIRSDKVTIRERGGCMECGACAKNCPFSAITVAAGVGCAGAIIQSLFRGGEPSCECSGKSGGSCCGPAQ